MASKLNFPSLQELIAAYTSSNQTPDTYKIGAGAVRGQELQDSVLNNTLKRQSDELALKKEIEDLKNKRQQKKKEQAYAESLQQGPVVATPGGQPVHANETIQGLSPEDRTLADIAQPFTKDVAAEQLKEIIQSKSEAGKLERAKLRQDQQNQTPDKIKQLFQLQDGRTVGVTYGGAIKEIDVPGGKLNPLDKPLPADNAQQLGDFATLSDQIQRAKDSYKPEFVGVVAGRTGKVAQTLDIPALGLGADTERSNFLSNINSVRNQLLYLRSGKQINEKEYERLLAELPDENKSSKDFEAKMKNFEAVFNEMVSNRKKSLAEGGYRVPGGANTPPAGGKPDIGAALRALLPKRK